MHTTFQTKQVIQNQKSKNKIGKSKQFVYIKSDTDIPFPKIYRFVSFVALRRGCPSSPFFIPSFIYKTYINTDSHEFFGKSQYSTYINVSAIVATA